jgi:hypothetical protein
MTKKLLFAGMILLVVAFVALASDVVTGKWVYETAGRNGGPARQTTLDLKADGAKLTGTVAGGGGGGRGQGGGGGAPGGGAPGGGAPQAAPISNGTVDNNNISFVVSRDTPNGAMVTKYEGVVTGGDMKLKVTRTGQDGTPQTTEFAAKKQ